MAAAHSLALPLSPNLLAEISGVSPARIRSDAILPLQDEAVLTAKLDLVQTRHPVIASAVMKVARDFHANVAETYAALTRGAIRLGRRQFIVGYEEFTYVCRRLEKSDEESALATARAASEEDPKILAYIHNLAHVLRICGAENEASGVCERAAKRLANLEAKAHQVRAFFYEWAAIEGRCGNPYISIWLAAISLSDMSPRTPAPSFQHIELALGGIGGNMLTLTNESDADFGRGVRAAETMIRGTELSTKAASFFARQRRYADLWKIDSISKAECLDVLHDEITVAWSSRERTLGELPGAASLKFKGLREALNLT
ncbi:hypothetical protein ABTZ46_11240 [Nocardioides sp. NPDC126508]